MIHKFYKIGKSIEWNSTSFWRDVKSLPDGDIYADVTDKKPSKTLQQIRYIHLLIGFIAETTGYTKEQAKTVIKDHRGMYEDFKYKDKDIRRYESFANLKLQDAESLINYLLDLCENLEIKVIPIETFFEQ